MAAGGACFMANDRYLGWTIAFLESFRAWNPELPLCLIPYDDHVDRVVGLADRHGFEVFDDPSLGELDALGASLLRGRGPLAGNAFRKLAAFWGPYERFAYLDSDIIVLADLAGLVEGREGAPLSACHRCPADDLYTSAALVEEATAAGYGLGVNTGAWSSRRGLFDLDGIRALAASAAARRDELAADGEQAFLNWCLMVDRVPIETFGETLGLHGWLWAGDAWTLRLSEVDGRACLVAPAVGLQTNLVHWAGFDLRPSMPHRALWRRYRWPGGGTDRLRRGADVVHGAADRVVRAARRGWPAG